MNYYIPYFNIPQNAVTPIMNHNVSRGFFSKLLGGLNWSSILTNTQKTLGIVNQTIPMVKQISPIMKNAKTMFKVMNEFKRIDAPSVTSNVIKNNEISNQTIIEEPIETNYDGGPTFFIN